MDDQAQRLIVSDEAGDTLGYIGWEVSQKGDLDKLAARLEGAGHSVTLGDKALADRRYVSDIIYCNDPAGNRVEIVWNPIKVSDPFVPGRPISGFKTGPYGMGHAVLHVADPTALVPFYCDILGFQLSDYGLKPVPLYFFHVNGRHHSFAIIGSKRAGFHHFMVEFDNLDDVGQGYDLAQTGMAEIAYTLGRHTNDYMTSYYAHTPSGFFVESGWGGRMIEPATWEPHETNVGPSFWGHERPYLPEAEREAFRNMCLQAASEGNRAPHMIDCPWLYGQFPGA
jgi:2,3-dihydroxybiphenyl 1,2-dioxygenase